MPFVEGHAHVGHVITPEDRAKGQLNALRAAEKKNAHHHRNVLPLTVL